MTTLTIRNLKPEIHHYLKVQAAQQGLSMEAEVRHVLEMAMLQSNRTPKSIAQKIQSRFKPLGAVDLAIPERELIQPPTAFE